MPSFCCVVGCSKRGDRDKTSFFRIPAILSNSTGKNNDLSRKRRTSWIRAIERNLTEAQLKYARVCASHFLSGKPASLGDTKNPDWIPCQNMGYEVNPNWKPDFAIYSRRKQRQRIDEQPETSNESKLICHEIVLKKLENLDDAVGLSGPNSTNIGTQTDLTMDDIKKLMEDAQWSHSKIQELRSKLQSKVFTILVK